MRRAVVLRLLAAGTTVAAAAITVALVIPEASAATGGVTGYASESGSTKGGAGGTTATATTGKDIHTALCTRASKDTPIIIEVEGTINHGNTSKVSGSSCKTADDVIELKGISNVTIIGVGRGATFDQIGIHIRESSNIVIQNVTIQNVKKSGSPTSNGGDAIGMEKDVHNIWVDHVNLKASGGESDGFDALFDMKDNTKYVTLSYSTLSNSGRGGLIGSSDTDTSSTFVTFHHNLYSNIESRTPLLRGGTAHMYNNYYVDLKKSGINSRAGAKAKVENNYFKNSKDVLGTFYTDLAGSWQVAGNTFDNVTWSSPDAETKPAGPNPTSNTTVTIPYSYSLDAASCVPSVVGETAGANKGMKVSTGNCSTGTNPTTARPTSTSTSSRPSSSARPSATPSQTSGTTAPSGTNLSLNAKSDGSSKASGTSYGDVRDGDMASHWSPSGATGHVSLKWSSATTMSKANIRESSGSVGNIKGWRLLNGDTGAVLASGTTAGVVSFPSTSLKKLTFEITSSSGTPTVAEFETYAS